MELLDRLNAALDYIEEHLETEISYKEAAKLAYLSVYQFQRLFPYIAGVPLAEYIRRRRLTQAAFALQNGHRVLDVALRYGYESPTAFNRAFQAMHGISPSAAKQPGTALKAFTRINFQITIKGDKEMEYRIEEKAAFRVIGMREPLLADIDDSFKRVPVFWQETHNSGVIPKLLELMNGEPQGLLGVCTCFGEDQENFYYIAVASDKMPPAGLYEMTVPAGLWAIFHGTGDGKSLQDLQKRIFAEWLPTSGYQWNNLPDVEVYLSEDPQNMAYEVWLPIV